MGSRKLARKIFRQLNEILAYFGFELLRRRIGVHERYMLDPTLVACQNERIAAKLAPAWDEINQHLKRPLINKDAIAQAVIDFREVFGEMPIHQSYGGSGFANSLNLFVACKVLDPSLIVESGVFRGLSSYLFGSSGNAEVISFDIDLSPLEFRYPGVSYHETDWIEMPLTSYDSCRDFCYFDDHVSHARRILEAYERGFRILLMDDSWPFETLYADGTPALPTLDMVLSPPAPGQEIRWTHGTERSYVFGKEDQHDCEEARKVIEGVVRLPTLFEETGMPHNSLLHVVILKSSKS